MWGCGRESARTGTQSAVAVNGLREAGLTVAPVDPEVVAGVRAELVEAERGVVRQHELLRLVRPDLTVGDLARRSAYERVHPGKGQALASLLLGPPQQEDSSLRGFGLALELAQRQVSKRVRQLLERAGQRAQQHEHRRHGHRASRSARDGARLTRVPPPHEG